MVLLDRTASNITGNRDEKGGMTGSKGPLVTFEPWAAVVSKQLLYSKVSQFFCFSSKFWQVIIL